MVSFPFLYALYSRRYILLLCPLLAFSTSVTAQTAVKAEPIENLTIQIERSAPAEVISLKQAVVSAEISAVVDSLPILTGDLLKEGQIIGNLNCIDYHLTLEQSRAQLEALTANQSLVEQQLSRLLKLRKTQNASEEQINQKQAEVRANRANINAQNIAIKIAQRQVGKCQIAAPFNGVITDIHTEKGNFIGPSSPVISMVDPDDIELVVSVTEQQLGEISHDQSLAFLFRKRAFPVEIRTILPVVDPTSQTRSIRLIFPYSKPLPGVRGQLHWELPGNILPASVVETRDDASGVFVVEHHPDGQTLARFVEISNLSPGQPAAVNLDNETLIITQGRNRLSDGELIDLR